jgi:soluble lytic murein transglycosylase-like protein
MRACVLALLPIAFGQPAFAHSHSHRHASHHFSRYHHHVEHRHHRAVHQRAPRDRSLSQDEAMRQTAAPQAFARTDSFESGWQTWQAQNAQPQSRSRNNRQPQNSWQQRQNSWQQRDVSQASPEWSDPSAAFDRGASRAERSSMAASHGALDTMIASHAAANGLPIELVHRVVKRESGYNPRARNPSGALGLMQIKYATARGVGYSGSASGLMDAETNLTYAVKYLAGAYQAAGGNANRAVAFYQSGYHGRGVAVARRTAAPEQVASNWGGQSWDMQTERVAMQDVDVTAVRVHRGHRWRHRR